MEAIFDQAHAQLEADDRARIGRLELARVARKIASDPSHPDRARRSELTEAQARRYLDARKQPAK